MHIRFDFKRALVERFGTQIEASKKLGIRESQLSRLVRGHVSPTEGEMQILKKALGPAVVRHAFDNKA